MNRLLLRVALRFCPREFRAEYGRQIAAESSQQYGLLAFFDVLRIGMALHCENVARDVAFAARMLAKAPVFAAVAVLALALAIGANVAVITMMKSLLIAPLPFGDPSHLVYIGQTYRGQRTYNDMSYPDVNDIAQQNQTLESIAIIRRYTDTLAGPFPTRVNAGAVSANYFDLLQIRPKLGRFFRPRDAGAQVVIISDVLWRNRFNADRSVLGRVLRIGDRSYTIVGVAPPGFVNPSQTFLMRLDIWTPVNPRQEDNPGNRQYSFGVAVGRLRAGTSVMAAQSDLSRIATALSAKYPQYEKSRGVFVVPLATQLLGPAAPVMTVMYIAVLLVFCIAAANVGNLLLVRAASREHEFTVRSALGASRRNLIMQLAAEAGVLALSGSALGVGLGWLALRGLKSVIAGAIPPWTNVVIPGWEATNIDLPVLLYVLLLAMLFTCLVSLLPAVRGRRNLSATLGTGERRGESVHAGKARKALAISEIAMACALLICATLLVRSFIAMTSTPVGFDSHNLYVMDIGRLPSNRYPTAQSISRFASLAEQKLRSLPGVLNATTAYAVPLSNKETAISYQIPGRIDHGDARTAWYDPVSPSFFSTLDVPILRGRAFSASDLDRSRPIAIVNRAFAEEIFNTLDVLGKHLLAAEGPNRMIERTIVGVVGDTRQSLDEPMGPQIYVPLAQVAWAEQLTVRTTRPDPQLGGEAVQVIRGLDPLLAPPQVLSIADLEAVNESQETVTAILLSVCAGIAAFLALAGIYAVVAFSVQRRTHEFGIRMALGARPRSILLGIVRDALTMTATGLGVGIVLAGFAAQAMAGQLVTVSPVDPVSFIAVAMLLIACTSFAAAIPARAAISVNPAKALRYE